MPEKTQDIIEQIFKLVGFSENTKEHAEKFFDLCAEQAYTEYVKSLPPEAQKSFIQTLGGDKEKILTMVKAGMHDKKYTEIFNKKIEINFAELVKEFLPNLSPEHIDELQTYLQALTSQNPQSEK